jgi:hypothetical protein
MSGDGNESFARVVVNNGQVVAYTYNEKIYTAVFGDLIISVYK